MFHTFILHEHEGHLRFWLLVVSDDAICVLDIVDETNVLLLFVEYCK